MEITTAEQNKEKRMKRIEDSLRDLWDNIKHTNIGIIGAPEKKRKREGMRKYLKSLKLKTSLIWERKLSIKSRKHRESHTGKIQAETQQDTY